MRCCTCLLVTPYLATLEKGSGSLEWGVCYRISVGNLTVSVGDIPLGGILDMAQSGYP